MTTGGTWLNRIAGWGFSCFATVLLTLSLSACTTTNLMGNQPITSIDEETGYRRMGAARALTRDDTIFMLSFSGGGTRASALSYGVMQELRDTNFIDRGRETRALDAVDSISSVSGGSFTAAYYGAFRERLFEDYEEVFLRRQVQSGLIARLLRPVNWLSSMFSATNRTEMAARYYDEHIFRGADFNDILEQGPPFIEINATELATGLYFNFTQERFDLLCSDLGSLPLARAVTASSAVPGVFPSVAIENHATQCDISNTSTGDLLAREQRGVEREAEAYLVDRVTAYRNPEERAYIHLVDGGISDNLGLRSLTDRLEHIRDHQFSIAEQHLPHNIVIVMVNAQVRRDRSIEQQRASPSLATTMATLTNVRMHNTNLETMGALQRGLTEFQHKVKAAGMETDIYFTEVSFDKVVDPKINAYLNGLPTSLELEADEVDRLIAVARLLLRHDPAFKQFKRDNQGGLAADAIASDDLCREFGYGECPDRIRE